MEPFFFLPSLLIAAWVFVLLRQWLALGAAVLAALSTVLAVAMTSALCMVWVGWQQKDEK